MLLHIILTHRHENRCHVRLGLLELIGFLIFLQAIAMLWPQSSPPIMNSAVSVPRSLVVVPSRTRSRKGSVSFANGTKNYVSACLLIKDSNDALREWLAYHYVMMPLRNLVVTVDYNNTQNPEQVLDQYKDMGLNYTVWNMKEILPDFREWRYRQVTFLRRCVRHMRKEGHGWVALIDVDEFISLNQINEDDEKFLQDVNKIDEEFLKEKYNFSVERRQMHFEQRKALPGQEDSDKPVTVLDAIKAADAVFPISSCYTMPRLLYGGFEEKECPNMDSVKATIEMYKLPYTILSTIRYMQHAVKGAFEPNRYGKVLIDASRINSTQIRSMPHNVHRPWDACSQARTPFEESILQANHYLGSLESFQATNDPRHTQEWYFERHRLCSKGGVSCELQIHAWLPPLIQQFGIAKVQQLLGSQDDGKASQ